jgi:hypothetical protein
LANIWLGEAHPMLKFIPLPYGSIQATPVQSRSSISLAYELTVFAQFRRLKPGHERGGWHGGNISCAKDLYCQFLTQPQS